MMRINPTLNIIMPNNSLIVSSEPITRTKAKRFKKILNELVQRA